MRVTDIRGEGLQYRDNGAIPMSRGISVETSADASRALEEVQTSKINLATTSK